MHPALFSFLRNENTSKRSAKPMIIVIRTQKRKKQFKCCVCYGKFVMEKDVYPNKWYVEMFRICPECAKEKGIRDKLDEMMVFYGEDRKRKPRLVDRVVTFFDRDGFSSVVVSAWKYVDGKRKVEKSKSQNRRKDRFLSVTIK